MIFPFSLVTRHSFLTPRNALCMACSCFTHQPPADTCDHIQKQQRQHHNHSIRRNVAGLHRLLPAQSWSQDPSFPTRSGHTPLRDAFCIRNHSFLCSLSSTLSAGPSTLQGAPHAALTRSTAFLEQLHLFFPSFKSQIKCHPLHEALLMLHWRNSLSSLPMVYFAVGV